MPSTIGLVLAAGSGERFGGPKALARTRDVPWVVAAVRTLRDGGCDPVAVVVGAAADEVVRLLDADVVVVRPDDWSDGMGASLRAGLAAIEGLRGEAVVVHLVDLPDVGADVVQRVVAAASAAPDALVRADYGAGPGHPVAIGRDHWAGVTASAGADRGARSYLVEHGARTVDCRDLATGQDVDDRRTMLDGWQ